MASSSELLGPAGRTTAFPSVSFAAEWLNDDSPQLPEVRISIFAYRQPSVLLGNSTDRRHQKTCASRNPALGSSDWLNAADRIRQDPGDCFSKTARRVPKLASSPSPDSAWSSSIIRKYVPRSKA